MSDVHGELLAGLSIVEVSSFVAGPLAGLTLAQLGADVIRIDPIGGAGDRTRWPLTGDGDSLYWAGLNRGKRSIDVDFRSPQGQRIVADIIARSGGIVVTNAAGRPWLDADALRADIPDLIHLHITGYRDGRTAVDYTVNAAVGFPLVTGPEDSTAPVNHVLPAWDIACGLYASTAILAAERRRRLTGEGSSITISLHDVALTMAGTLGYLPEAELNGTLRVPIGNHLYGSFARDFATADGERIMLVALTSRHWASLVELTGTAEQMAQIETETGADLTTDSDRYAHRHRIATSIEPWFLHRSIDEVTTALEQHNLLWSRYQSFAQASTNDVPKHPLFTLVPDPRLGSHHVAASPIVTQVPADRPAPAAAVPGADTERVLREVLELLDDHAIEELRNNGVVR